MTREFAVGGLVRYEHPDWGPTRGRVLSVVGRPGHVLVQDQAPTGAREWWPSADLERVVG